MFFLSKHPVYPQSDSFTTRYISRLVVISHILGCIHRIWNSEDMHTTFKLQRNLMLITVKKSFWISGRKLYNSHFHNTHIFSFCFAGKRTSTVIFNLRIILIIVRLWILLLTDAQYALRIDYNMLSRLRSNASVSLNIRTIPKILFILNLVLSL